MIENPLQTICVPSSSLRSIIDTSNFAGHINGTVPIRTEQDIRAQSLIELILKGYSLSEVRQNVVDDVSLNHLKAFIMDSFPIDDGRAICFIATKDHAIIGNLTLLRWRNKNVDKRGILFFPYLKQCDQQLYERIESQNSVDETHVYDVSGIVVHQDHRGSDISRALYHSFINKYQPSLLIGQTKTVEAVCARSKLSDFGYRTFYGNYEIFPDGTVEKTNVHEVLYQAVFYARGAEKINAHSTFWTHRGNRSLTATPPEIHNNKRSLTPAFEQLIEEQKIVGESQTVMSFLLSVAPGLLEQLGL